MLSDELSALHDAINYAGLVRLRETLVVLPVQSNIKFLVQRLREYYNRIRTMEENNGDEEDEEAD